MGDAPVGQRAASLPWLCPAVPSLLALTDEYPDPRVLAADPGIVLLALRYVRPSPAPADYRLDVPTLAESVLPEAAARHIESSPLDGRPDRDEPIVRELFAFARTAARTAHELARHRGTCSPDAAATAAQLAPLGWLLVSAVAPEAATRVRGAIAAGDDPADAQSRDWGLTHDGIVRRVGDRWRLPRWLTAVVAHLHLQIETAVHLGAPAELFAVVRDAVSATEESRGSLGLTSADGCGAAQPRGLTAAVTPTVADNTDAPNELLIRLLKIAARVRRTESASRLTTAHAELDRVHAELRRGEGGFEDRLRDAKLAALAELAAGAGHEINNPLAVISGNAQRLLARSSDAGQRNALDAILRQSRRLADIVHELMQFARPREPVRRTIDLGLWLAQVCDECRPLAAVKAVEFHQPTVAGGILIHADAGQLGRSLTAMIRNGIEAAKADGWVRVTVLAHAGTVSVVVEDSGPGPDANAVEHLFDPFYSGRPAGRGRGLGLPMAWRLARENGGNVRFVPSADGSTRFVLDLPLVLAQTDLAPGRKSA